MTFAIGRKKMKKDTLFIVLMALLGAANRTQAVVLALEQGMFD
jgi:hypothetical protein